MGSTGPFISTDLELSPKEIITNYSNRFSIEEMFKSLKEVCGLDKQQVRNLVCIQMIILVYTLVEFWAKNKNKSDLESNRPVWEDIDCRPSHKDKRTALQFELYG